MDYKKYNDYVNMKKPKTYPFLLAVLVRGVLGFREMVSLSIGKYLTVRTKTQETDILILRSKRFVRIKPLLRFFTVIPTKII
jgi:hypothetical protein